MEETPMRFYRMFATLAMIATFAACGTLPGTGGGGGGGASGAAGAPLVSTQGAQMVGQDQAQVPSEANATGGVNNWFFASQQSHENQAAIIALAQEQGWTPEKLVAALKSTNGAPDEVTITVTGNVDASGASATAIGSGTGGGAGAGRDMGQNP